jgi:hypothetical protein
MICQEAGFTEYTRACLEPAAGAVCGEPLVVE